MTTLILSHTFFEKINQNNFSPIAHDIEVIFNITYSVRYSKSLYMSGFKNILFNMNNIKYIPESVLQMITLIQYNSIQNNPNTTYDQVICKKLSIIFSELLEKEFITNLQSQDIIKNTYEQDILKIKHTHENEKECITSKLKDEIINLKNLHENEKECITSKLKDEIINLKNLHETKLTYLININKKSYNALLKYIYYILIIMSICTIYYIFFYFNKN